MEIFSSDAPASVQIAAGSAPRSVRWNGGPVAGVYDKEKGLVALKKAI
jgi:hypothetical protein